MLGVLVLYVCDFATMSGLRESDDLVVKLERIEVFASELHWLFLGQWHQFHVPPPSDNDETTCTGAAGPSPSEHGRTCSVPTPRPTPSTPSMAKQRRMRANKIRHGLWQRAHRSTSDDNSSEDKVAPTEKRARTSRDDSSSLTTVGVVEGDCHTNGIVSQDEVAAAASLGLEAATARATRDSQLLEDFRCLPPDARTPLLFAGSTEPSLLSMSCQFTGACRKCSDLKHRDTNNCVCGEAFCAACRKICSGCSCVLPRLYVECCSFCERGLDDCMDGIGCSRCNCKIEHCPCDDPFFFQTLGACGANGTDATPSTPS